MKIRFLGTGTSSGIPALRCNCDTCRSGDVRDKRLRVSLLVEVRPGAKQILIDCGPDLRQQLLSAGSPDLACVLISHIHYDHAGGIDDLRPYTYEAGDGKFPVFCREDVASDLRAHIPYAFLKDHYKGVPTFDLRIVEPFKPFDVDLQDGKAPVKIMPVGVLHGKLPILGYRIGDFAFITDCLTLPEESYEALQGVKWLVINALRPKPHFSHQSLSEALAAIERINPQHSWLIHMSHDMPPHAIAQTLLPAGVELAYDGLEVEIP